MKKSNKQADAKPPQLSIAEIVQANKMAKETANMAFEEAKVYLEMARLPPNRELRFWEVLRDLIATCLPKPKLPDHLRPMSPEQATAFGQNTIIPFGKYQGKPVDAAPLDHLGWMSEPDTPFKRDVRRYLASLRIKHEQRVANDQTEEQENTEDE